MVLVKAICLPAFTLESVSRGLDKKDMNLSIDYKKKLFVLDVGSLCQGFTDELGVDVEGRDQCGFYSVYNLLCYEQFLVKKLDNLWKILKEVTENAPATQDQGPIEKSIKKELKTLFKHLKDRQRFTDFYREMYLHQVCVALNKNSVASVDLEEEFSHIEEHNINTLSLPDVQSMGDIRKEDAWFEVECEHVPSADFSPVVFEPRSFEASIRNPAAISHWEVDQHKTIRRDLMLLQQFRQKDNCKSLPLLILSAAHFIACCLSRQNGWTLCVLSDSMHSPEGPLSTLEKFLFP